jgi:alkaline phosphatase
MNLRRIARRKSFLLVTLSLSWTLLLPAATASMAAAGNHASSDAKLLDTFTLPPTSLDVFAPAHRHYDLAQAQADGLRFTNLPSIGSGLARRADGALFGITDRGPNAETAEKKRLFPIPDFCPAIVQLDLTNHAIGLRQMIPLTGTHGRPLTGLSNDRSEEAGFSGVKDGKRLLNDPNGVDPESIRCLPGGDFVLGEEYSPSLLVVSPRGRVLMRYTPVSKPLVGANYPVQPILPDILCQRRVNRGFENLALSRDGRTLYAILQSPMGDRTDARYAGSRMIRVLQMDFAEPLQAQVTGMYLVPASAFSSFPGATKQDKIKLCDSEWLAPKRLLLLENGPGESRLLVADFNAATDVLNLPAAASLQLEDGQTDLKALGISPATVTTVFSTKPFPAIDSDKLEGLALLAPDKIALANDNDFGIGENPNGEPSRIWILQVPALSAFEQ